MSTLDIARHALPLLVSSCELVEFNINFAGEGWHLNAACDVRIEAAGHVYTDESGSEQLRKLERHAIGRSIVAIESNPDMDDPIFFLDDGTRVSLSADADDPYEPWTMRVPGITLLGRSPARVEYARRNQHLFELGALSDLGEVKQVRSFPPGWSMSGDDWRIVVASRSWHRKLPLEDSRQGIVPDAYVGRRLDRVEYETHRCAMHFDDGSRIDVISDDGREPWFLRFDDGNRSIIGLPIHDS